MGKSNFLGLIAKLELIAILGIVQIGYPQDDAVSWFKRGAETPDTREKITYYLEAIKLNPKFVEAYYNLGYVYKNLGDFNNAEKAFRQALLTDPSKLDNEKKLKVTYELGITLKKLNQYDEALETLLSAKNLARETEIRVAVLYELGRLKLLIEDFDGALSEFNEGLQLNSSKQSAFQTAIQNTHTLRNTETFYTQGLSFLEKRQYDNAIDALTKVVKANPAYKNADQKLTEAQKLKDEHSQKENLVNIYSRGIGYMNNKDWDNAIIAFKQVERIDPNYKDLKAKLTEAKAKLDQSLQQEVYNKLYTDALSDYNKGNWAKAIISFEKVMEWDPNYKSVNRWYREAQNKLNREGENSVKNRFYTQGKSDFKSGNWQAAIESFKQIIALDPNYKDVQFLFQQAQSKLTNEVASQQLGTYYDEAINYYNNGDWLKAILAFEKIQQIDPNYKDASEKLIAAKAQLDPKKVGDLSQNTISESMVSTRKPGRWVKLGAIISLFLIPLGVAFFMMPTTRAKWLLMQGNYQKAALIYESILMKKPDKVKLYQSLAHIYLLLNRNDETAQKVYDIALRMNVSPLMKQRIQSLTNSTQLNDDDNEIVSLEEKLRRELNSLRSS